ncbi:superoxide dismutase [Peziza echinospora]|nr:superoxide dismutase [Peziza echinospora]
MQIISTSSAALAALFFSTLVLGQTAPETGKPEDTTGARGDAKTFDNPAGAVYWADFSKTAVSGSIKFMSSSDKDGVRVEVDLSKFPGGGVGPFGYHVHDAPVPTDGNCTGTLAHLDPFVRGQKVVCDPKRPQSCEVGDLAGKYGKIPDSSYVKSYVDPYITLTQGVGSFIGNRSIVIHTLDTKRYACANITMYSGNVTVPKNETTNGPIKFEGSDGNRLASTLWGCGVGVAVGLRMLMV